MQGERKIKQLKQPSVWDKPGLWTMVKNDATGRPWSWGKDGGIWSQET